MMILKILVLIHGFLLYMLFNNVSSLLPGVKVSKNKTEPKLLSSINSI